MSEDRELALSLTGCTIASVEWIENGDGDEWGDCQRCILTLTDGRIIDFGAWGHDAWGVTLRQRI